MYYFHKANIEHQSVVCVVSYRNDHPLVRLSIFAFITIRNIHLTPTPVVGNQEQGVEGKYQGFQKKKKRQMVCA